mgnify:CR=1 FL=1
MWNRFCIILNNILAKFRQNKELTPNSFKKVAEEIRELAILAGKLWPDDRDFQQRIKRIQNEMDQLEQMAERREFKQLSPEKRKELKDSLIKSKEQLLNTLHSAPTPTERIQ